MMTMNNWRKLYSASVTVTFTAWGMIRHIKIVRCDGKEVACNWDTLQAIKDELLGEDAVAIEVFPSHSKVLTAYENPTKSKEIG